HRRSSGRGTGGTFGKPGRNQARDSQSCGGGNWSGGSENFSETTEMDREEHSRQSRARYYAGEVIEGTSGAQRRVLAEGAQMGMTAEGQQMIEHIVRMIRKPGLTIDENTPLVSSGLIDSMALVDLLLKLEDLTHRRLP